MPLVAAVALIGFIFSALQNKCPANAASTLVPTICPLKHGGGGYIDVTVEEQWAFEH